MAESKEHFIKKLNPDFIKTIKMRKIKSKAFSVICLFCFLCCIFVVGLLFCSVIKSGISGMISTSIYLKIKTDGKTDPREILKSSIEYTFHADKSGVEMYKGIFGKSSIDILRQKVNSGKLKDDDVLKLPAEPNFDVYYKSKLIDIGLNEKNDYYELVIDAMKKLDVIGVGIGVEFFKNSNSSYPEQAGIYGSVKGSVFVLIVFFFISVPLSIVTAIYLEEFSRSSKLKKIIEVNINNLAAVPSIIYGLLGLLVFINFMGLPRSSSLVGGFTVSLLVIPINIIAVRSALKSVPKTLRLAARALGAGETRTAFLITLPAAMPTIITGIILSLGRIVGETAPLIIIGMVAFVGNPPSTMLDPSTTIPVQIYLWASDPNQLLVQKSSALILCLITILFVINIAANYMNKKFEIKW